MIGRSEGVFDPMQGRAAAATPRPRFASFLDEVRSELAELEQRVTDLTERLDPVLAPRGPEKDQPAPANIITPARSDHGGTLGNFQTRLAELNRHLNDVMQRLEL